MSRNDANNPNVLLVFFWIFVSLFDQIAKVSFFHFFSHSFSAVVGNLVVRWGKCQ